MAPRTAVLPMPFLDSKAKKCPSADSSASVVCKGCPLQESEALQTSWQQSCTHNTPVFQAIMAGGNLLGYVETADTAMCLSFHPWISVLCMRSKAWLAALVLLAHAEVTENIKYFSMGPKLRHTAVPYVFSIWDGPQHARIVSGAAANVAGR
jgi:hypothetical protein